MIGKLKEVITRLNDPDILGQYMVPYGAEDLSRYKHIDEIQLINGDVLKATLGPIDLGVFPYDTYVFYTVPDHEENRLDIIAYKLYGESSMYWAIAYANQIKDPLILPEGTVLLVPSINTLKRFPNPLS